MGSPQGSPRGSLMRSHGIYRGLIYNASSTHRVQPVGSFWGILGEITVTNSVRGKIGPWVRNNIPKRRPRSRNSRPGFGPFWVRVELRVIVLGLGICSDPAPTRMFFLVLAQRTFRLLESLPRHSVNSTSVSNARSGRSFREDSALLVYEIAWDDPQMIHFPWEVPWDHFPPIGNLLGSLEGNLN